MKSRTQLIKASIASLASLLSIGALAAPNAVATGGMSAPGDAVISDVLCLTNCVSRYKATPGSLVKVKGEFLDYTSQVVFKGPSGALPAAPTYRDALRVRALVPAGAVTGRVSVTNDQGSASSPAPRALQILPTSALPTYVFPIRGRHTYGSTGSNFGAGRSGRSHQGQDLMSPCGTRLVSAASGRVEVAGYQGATGNYAVIDTKGSKADLVYMHMAKTPLVTKGQRVSAGQPIGVVGDTGNAQGCHLHFEYWVGQWWGGGRPIDPLRYLKAWDRVS